MPPKGRAPLRDRLSARDKSRSPGKSSASAGDKFQASESLQHSGCIRAVAEGQTAAGSAGFPAHTSRQHNKAPSLQMLGHRHLHHGKPLSRLRRTGDRDTAARVPSPNREERDRSWLPAPWPSPASPKFLLPASQPLTLPAPRQHWGGRTPKKDTHTQPQKAG